jgi:hypothetical protein
MRKFVLAVAAGALFALPLAASAAPLSTDLSSQSIEVGPGGVRVGHERFDSRRRDGDRVIVRERRERLSRSECSDLRRACLNKDKLGEQGEGNCRRYRTLCK